MRICIVYDCLFPHTVGGAERWYRALAERLATDGHDVTYLTLRQWDKTTDPSVRGVRVRVVGPQMRLYAGPGRRRVLPPLVFGAGVLSHLLAHGRDYDVVHTASFPYFSVLAAAAVRPFGAFRLIVDWHEVWTRSYWQDYLGRVAGEVGYRVQRVCARVPQVAFCFSRLHAARLRGEGAQDVEILPGEYAGPYEPRTGLADPELVVFAGRHIPEKQVLSIAPAIKRLRQSRPSVRAVILGDGPDRAALLAQIAELGLEDVISAPGFISSEEVDALLAQASCLLLPSRREGYGMVVIEAASRGTPSVVIAGEDNAAVELVEEGINGFVARSAEADALATTLERALSAGAPLRASTARWFSENARRRSLEASLERVEAAYAAG